MGQEVRERLATVENFRSESEDTGAQTQGHLCLIVEQLARIALALEGLGDNGVCVYNHGDGLAIDIKSQP